MKLVTGLLFAMLVGSAPSQDQVASPAATPARVEPRELPGWSESFGALMPRPVDAAQRQALGFAAPREVAAVLAELDALAATLEQITATDAAWKQRYREYRALQRRRIDCISELEEQKYAGERLQELLAAKLDDISDVGALDTPRSTSYDQLRYDLAQRHAGSPAAIQARVGALMDQVHMLLRADMRVHPGDYDALAAAELARKSDREAGILILEALVGERNAQTGDAALTKKWKDWLIEKLPPSSLGYRHVMRERMFGAPIRLQGKGLAGEELDTQQWLGDVVLVDFWGMWCVPCREAMPHLEEMHDKYAARGLRIVGVLCDHELAKAEGWLKEKGFGWPQFADRTLTPKHYDHPIAERYAIGGFPTLWIIDRKGVLREEVDREELEKTVVRYLDEAK